MYILKHYLRIMSIAIVYPMNQLEPETSPSLQECMVAEHGGQVIAEMRASDGYVNATKMCQSGGKLWADYGRLDTSRSFMMALSSNMGIPILDLVVSQRGGNHIGTWVHYRIAIHVAMWISPEFAVAVTALVEQYLTGRLLSSDSRANENRNAMVIHNTNTNSPCGLVSAGYNKYVLGNQLYFGIPGPKLVFETDLQGGFGVKFGITREGNERKRFKDHISEYGGFYLLDCLQCRDPDVLETKLKHMTFIQSRRVFGKVENKTHRDTELVHVRDQSDYNNIVHVMKEIVDTINHQYKDEVEVILAKERTKQAEELTKQEQEKTKQLELQLEILRLQTRQTETIVNNGDIVVDERETMDIDDVLRAEVQAEVQEVTNMNDTPTLYTVHDPIPILTDPISLYECYQQWLQVRDYFKCVQMPPWKEKFGINAAQHKLRYSRMRPFFTYMDKYGDTPAKAQFLLNHLEHMRQEFQVTPTAFVKQCFYVLFRPSPSVENKSPIARNVFINALRARRLPIE